MKLIEAVKNAFDEDDGMGVLMVCGHTQPEVPSELKHNDGHLQQVHYFWRVPNNWTPRDMARFLGAMIADIAEKESIKPGDIAALIVEETSRFEQGAYEP